MTQGIANQGTNRLIVEAFAQRHPDMTHISALALQKLLGVSQSRTMLESVISTLGLSTDTAHLKDQITILHPADTHILRIVAADSSPQRAADIANALAALALDDLSARMGTTPPRLVEQAAPPQRFSGPGAVFHAAFGAGIGFLLCFAFLCLHYLRDDHIYTADDLTRCLGSSPLACIPDATPRRLHTRKGGRP